MMYFSQRTQKRLKKSRLSALVVENIPNLVCGYHLGIARAKNISGEYLALALKSFEVRKQFSVWQMEQLGSD